MRNNVGRTLAGTVENLYRLFDKYPDIKEIPNARVFYTYTENGCLAIVVDDQETVNQILGSDESCLTEQLA